MEKQKTHANLKGISNAKIKSTAIGLGIDVKGKNYGQMRALIRTKWRSMGVTEVPLAGSKKAVTKKASPLKKIAPVKKAAVKEVKTTTAAATTSKTKVRKKSKMSEMIEYLQAGKTNDQLETLGYNKRAIGSAGRKVRKLAAFKPILKLLQTGTSITEIKRHGHTDKDIKAAKKVLRFFK